VTTDQRPTPFELVFADLATERFGAIRDSLAAANLDPRDANAFALDRQVVLLLRDLVPDDAPEDAPREHLALLRHAFLSWRAGGWTFRLGRSRTMRLLTAGLTPSAGSAAAPPAYYIQFPARMLWAELVPEHPHEPLDGLFVHSVAPSEWEVMGIFGVHPDRAGFSVVDAAGPRPPRLQREDGSPPFASVLPGGTTAELFSVVGAEEIIELAARTAPLVTRAAADHRVAPPEGIHVE
jgi:hypothetical protein